jgi:hypothetical protein
MQLARRRPGRAAAEGTGQGRNFARRLEHDPVEMSGVFDKASEHFGVCRPAERVLCVRQIAAGFLDLGNGVCGRLVGLH